MMSSLISTRFLQSTIKLITRTNLILLQRNNYATHTGLYSLRRQLDPHNLSQTQWPPKPPPPPPPPRTPRTPKTTSQKVSLQKPKPLILQLKHRRQNSRRHRKINPLKIYTQTLGSSSDNKGVDFSNQIQNILQGRIVYEDKVRFLRTLEAYWKRHDGFVFLDGEVELEERRNCDGCWGLAGCILGFVVGVKVYIDWKVGVSVYGLRGKLARVEGMDEVGLDGGVDVEEVICDMRK